ncbi:uncharacterized protein PGTG_09324 [Puccinia graminis f. sp. tritici CRL 75-36-700-3]|uniref:Uncharacterized protein n=1 Tax=Puccinia graminis f. sp. tritici (strain CRL 75-36-700-3 / race SCCL) TaxID=418459 RepID=E3KH36_PUCGT|nr:uncharacterized protein PGTG_09324 [Puccinia graminis f. sp. tritici CRL 75-36-700-3]EFP83611.1 hypothetical protein PGTG_09324 [Puccinia graminis f. sp. tritici CRL 75-36-700-3]
MDRGNEIGPLILLTLQYIPELLPLVQSGHHPEPGIPMASHALAIGIPMPGQIPADWKYNRYLPHSNFENPIGNCGVTAELHDDFISSNYHHYVIVYAPKFGEAVCFCPGCWGFYLFEGPMVLMSEMPLKCATSTPALEAA